jgi:fatty acid desaturase
MNSDPLVTTTSVVVHPIFDLLHLNFSYHTEHHLFPGMNSDYYPKVSRLLMQEYENRYNRITFSDAWNRLWKMHMYEASDSSF